MRSNNNGKNNERLDSASKEEIKRYNHNLMQEYLKVEGHFSNNTEFLIKFENSDNKNVIQEIKENLDKSFVFGKLYLRFLVPLISIKIKILLYRCLHKNLFK